MLYSIFMLMSVCVMSTAEIDDNAQICVSVQFESLREELVLSLQCKVSVSMYTKQVDRRFERSQRRISVVFRSSCIYTVSPKNVRLFIFQITLSNINRF